MYKLYRCVLNREYIVEIRSVHAAIQCTDCETCSWIDKAEDKSFSVFCFCF